MDWESSATVVVTGGPLPKLRELAKEFTASSKKPVFWIAIDASKEEIAATTKACLSDPAEHRVLVYEGPTSVFNNTLEQPCNRDLYDFCHYRLHFQLRTTLVILAEDVLNPCLSYGLQPIEYILKLEGNVEFGSGWTSPALFNTETHTFISL